MGTKEIRRGRLRELLKEYKTNAALAEVLGYTASYISHLKTGHRGIGEEVARHIERAANKPPGWMDGKDDPADLLPADERALVLKYRKADKRGKRHIHSVAEDQSAYAGPDLDPTDTAPAGAESSS